MFTGIVQGTASIMDIQQQPGLRRLLIELPDPVMAGLQVGASVSIDGVCLTVAQIQKRSVWFDVMQETLQKTTLGQLTIGDRVNTERSARMGDEIGGHVMSGHVSCLAEIVDVRRPENNTVMTFRVDPSWMRFIFSKGFIGLDGVSLTVVDADREAGTFQVWFIPETLKQTRFGSKGVGDQVHVELDPMTQTIVETVERVLESSTHHS